MTDNLELKNLKNGVPRNWNKSSYDRAAGVYEPDKKIIFIGVRGDFEGREDCGVHELGHGLARYIGNLIHGKPLFETEEVNYIMQKESHDNYYFHNADEFVANAFDMLYKDYEFRKEFWREHLRMYKYMEDLEKLYLCNFNLFSFQ